MLGSGLTAVELATAMGYLAADLARVEVAGLVLDQAWSRAVALAAAARDWRDRIETEIEPATGDRIDVAFGRAIERGGDLWGGDSAGFGHGDFAPVNVIARDDGGLTLIDFEHARIAPRVVDLAWWGWIVRYHHPERLAVAWPAFLAAGLTGHEPDFSALRGGCLVDLQVLAVLERAAAASDVAARARWLDRLRVTALWPDTTGQAGPPPDPDSTR